MHSPPTGHKQHSTRQGQTRATTRLKHTTINKCCCPSLHSPRCNPSRNANRELMYHSYRTFPMELSGCAPSVRVHKAYDAQTCPSLGVTLSQKLLVLASTCGQVVPRGHQSKALVNPIPPPSRHSPHPKHPNCSQRWLLKYTFHFWSLSWVP